MAWRLLKSPALLFFIFYAVESTHLEEISLAQQFAESAPLVGDLKEDGKDTLRSLADPLLGESAETDTDTDFLLEAITKYDKKSWKNFVSLQANDKQKGSHEDDPPRYYSQACVVTLHLCRHM
jgi:hypothetical protein